MKTPPSFINERYEVLRTLGAGGMGDVLLVRDHLSSGRPLRALKMLQVQPKLRAQIDASFRREFQTLTVLEHPGLARVYDYGRDREGGLPFYTAEFIEGRDLYLASRPLSVSQIIRILAKVCDALDYIHSRGILHNDLKTENILIEESTGAPRLLDFGLSRLVTKNKTKQLFGTPAYLAPEIIKGSPTSVRSDLFALGMVFFRVLSGAFPFSDKEPGAILKAIETATFPTPRSVNALIAPPLDRLVMQLLAKDPNLRPASAREVGDQLLSLEGAADLSGADTASYLQTQNLIGRQHELRLLRTFIDKRVRPTTTQQITLGDGARSSSIAYIVAESGLGKTLLLRTLKNAYQLADIPFLLTSCGISDGPLYPLRQTLAELRGLLEKESPALAQHQPLFHYLDQLKEKSPSSVGLDQTGFFLKILAFLEAALEEQPFVIAWDDIEGKDASLSEFLIFWRQFEEGPLKKSLPPLLLTPKEPPAPNSRETLAKTLWLELSPLSAPAVGELLEELLRPGAPPPGWVERIHERCAGNPSFVKELFQNLVATKVLKRQQGKWNVEDVQLERLATPHSLREILEQKLARLKGPERAAVEFLATLNLPIGTKGLDFLKREIKTDALDLFRALALQGILEERAGKWFFAQGLWPEIIAAHLQDPVHVSRLAAEYLESLRDKPLAHLARLLAKAQEPERATKIAGAAAKEATALFSLQDAAKIWALALEQALKTEDAAAISEALGGSADIAWRLGQRKAALDTYQKILGQKSTLPVSNTQLRSQAWRAFGLSHRDQGETPKALEAFQHALEALGPKDFEDRLELSAQIAMTYAEAGNKHQATQLLQTIMGDLESRKKGQTQHLHVYLLAAAVSARLEHLNRAQEIYEKALELATPLTDTRTRCIALNNLAALAATRGRRTEARTLAEKALETSRQLGEAQRLCHALITLGNLEYLAGAYRKASIHLQEALQLARLLDKPAIIGQVESALGQLECDRGHYDFAKLHLEQAQALRPNHPIVLRALAELAFQLGQFPQALALIQTAKNISPERGLQLSLWDLEIRCRIALNDGAGLTEAAHFLENLSAPKEHPDQTVLAHLLRALIAQSHGKLQEAAEILGNGVALIEEVNDPILRVRFFYTASLYGKATALALAQALSLLENPEWLWRGHLRCAEIFEREGALPQALKNLEAAEATLGTLAMKPGDAATQEGIAALKHRLQESPALLGPRVAALEERVESFRRLAEVNRQLAAVWTNRQGLVQYILDTALELVGGKRGFLVLKKAASLELVASRQFSASASWDPENSFSRSVVKETLATGQPQVVFDAGSDPALHASRSVQALDLRSVICVPLCWGAQVLGAFYIDDHERAGLYGANESEILCALSDQAVLALQQANALENKDQEVQVLTQELSRTRLLLQHQARTTEWKYSYAQILGGIDPTMQAVFALLDSVIPTKATVLIQGESGSGKELVAQAIHYNGPRKQEPFVSINCSGLNPHLLESELFGHLKGSFTGADRDKEGLFSVAHGGTLFLDEIADMPMEIQVKLLRVLQEGEIRPVGSSQSHKIDVRLIAASNKSLPELVQNGRFREDLYYRLHVVEIRLPALRERPADLGLLIDGLLKKACKTAGTKLKTVSEAAKVKLLAYPWPGNVRELENLLQALVATQKKKRLEVDDLPPAIRDASLKSKQALPDLEKARDVFMKDYLEALLRETEGNVSEAARRANIFRKSLYRMLEKYGIRS